MMQTLYKVEGAQFRIEILEKPKIQEFINTHASILDSTFEKVEMSDAMRRRLQRSDYIFSGMKTFHELNEAFPSLLDENGNRKSFEQFLNDVRKIDKTYNENYLRAEYNFVQGSAQMAAKWENFMKDGDRYNLQYRTAGDDKVRPEHAALDRVTLPITDTFWEEYYPPNGWNCRCTVVQVLKDKYPVTPHNEAMALGEEATGKDTKGIFRFNPGIEQKTVPDYNPYTIRRCRDCDIAKGRANESKGKLAWILPSADDFQPKVKGKQKFVFIPDNELCAACRLVRALANADAKQTRKYAKPLQGTAINTPQFPHPINISRASITEWTNQPNKYLQEKNKMLLRINEVLQNAEYLGIATPPPGKSRERVIQHHIFSTKVKGEEQYIIVWEWDWGEYTLHSISDHPEKIRKHIKKK